MEGKVSALRMKNPHNKGKKRGEENRGNLLARNFGDGISTVLCSRRSGVITHDGPLIRLSPSSLEEKPDLQGSP